MNYSYPLWDRDIQFYNSDVISAAEWLALLLRILEISVSNLGLETGHPF
jgi:hypothetical protein